MNLKVRVSTLIITGCALALLVAGVVTWRELVQKPRAERAALGEGLDDLERRARSPGSARAPKLPPFIRSMHSSSRPSDPARDRDEYGEGIPVFVPPPEGDPGELGPEEAIATFQQTLVALETALEEEYVLTLKEQHELYNQATGSFEAMSNWIDGSSPDDRALMEDAYMHMKVLMGELKLERPPVVQEYDHHHPTFAPLPEGARLPRPRGR